MNRYIALFIMVLLMSAVTPSYPWHIEKYQLNKNEIYLKYSLQENEQETPVLIDTESHQRFIELCEKYNLPADVIWHTENYYWLKEGTVLCVSIAETGGGREWWGREWCWNYWNVGNNDWGNRKCFPNQWAGLAAIWQTLKNDNLKNNQTISCLNGAWECIEPNANWKRYSTWKSGNRQRNLIACFYDIYQTPINPQTFNLHDR